MDRRQLKLSLLLGGWLLLSGDVWAVTPAWQGLTPAQQLVLAPVAQKWAGMSDLQRSRLLAVAAKYPKLKPEQQQRFQRRLIVWSSMTPEQRELARRNYLKFKHLPKSKRQIVKKELMKTYPPVVAPDTPVATTPISATTAVVSPVPAYNNPVRTTFPVHP